MATVNALHLLFNLKINVYAHLFKLLRIINVGVLKGNIMLNIKDVKIVLGHAQLVPKVDY
jgi:hypothetical protein